MFKAIGCSKIGVVEILDYAIFFAYLIILIGVGLYHYFKTSDIGDYYLGGRKIGAFHIGMSVVATDVGGGFSIGLGGLGFAIGLSGSWMLFTGLIGAWISAVWLIPKVFKVLSSKEFYTMPQLMHHFYGPRVAFTAGLISFVGYLGFTASQILAGAKLASATFEGISFTHLLIIMGVFTVLYTALGGLKAVIYTDTIQWLILMLGLLFLGIPYAYMAVGGWDSIMQELPEQMLRLDQISLVMVINWSLTIIPIWFVGMTLYQRIFASRNEKQAKRAWFLAGFLEWPIMAFMGVGLGILSRVAFEQGLFVFPGIEDPELGLPLLIKTVLPVGVTGVILAAYFSAVMSTADSCLMGASGNFVSDILGKVIQLSPQIELRLSQLSTLVLGAIAVFISMQLESVLELMLLSYAFMVSGLFIPVIMALGRYSKNSTAAIASMISGGVMAAGLSYFKINLWYDLDANVFGIFTSLVVFIAVSRIVPSKNT